MSSVYCWFDWEDDTTTVNSISVIQEPRKPWNEYEIGEKIIAKLPKYGTWGGVIVEISDSKEDLVRHMNDRQQYPVYTDINKAVGGNVGITGVALDSSSGTKRKSKKAELAMNEEKLADPATGNEDIVKTGSAPGSRIPKKKKSGNAKNDEKTVDFETDDDGPECDDQSIRPKKKPKKTEKTKNEEKVVDTENQKKSREEKQKKKELEKVRLETKTKEYQDIISQRRAVTHESATVEQVGSVDEYEKQLQHIPDVSGGKTDNTFPNATPSPNNSYYYEQGIPENYSYVQDLRETDMQFGTSSFQSLLSYQELLEQNRDLEAENYNLRQEVKELKERLDSRSPPQGSLPDLEVTPRKIEFFKRLTRTLEISQKGSSKQLFQHTITNSTHSTPVRNIASPSHNIPPPPAIYNTPVRSNNSTNKPKQITPVNSPSAALNSPLLEGDQSENEPTYHWEDNVTSAGQKKVQLVSNVACYITQGQLSHALHVGNQPRKLVIALLDTLFTREQLAKSNSTGTRSAVNSSCKTAALPSNAVKAIKTFTLNQFKNDNGVPCLSDAMFNTVINSKCATARRSLK